MHPAAYVAEHVDAWAVGALGQNGNTVILAAAEPAFRRQVGDALAAAGYRVAARTDIAAVAAPSHERAKVGAAHAA
jgi:hypothetical protein